MRLQIWKSFFSILKSLENASLSLHNFWTLLQRWQINLNSIMLKLFFSFSREIERPVLNLRQSYLCKIHVVPYLVWQKAKPHSWSRWGRISWICQSHLWPSWYQLSSLHWHPSKPTLILCKSKRQNYSAYRKSSIGFVNLLPMIRSPGGPFIYHVGVHLLSGIFNFLIFMIIEIKHLSMTLFIYYCSTSSVSVFDSDLHLLKLLEIIESQIFWMDKEFSKIQYSISLCPVSNLDFLIHFNIILLFHKIMRGLKSGPFLPHSINWASAYCCFLSL